MYISNITNTDVFQSSPLSQEGRYPLISYIGGEACRFQSSPLSQEGRYGGLMNNGNEISEFQSSPLSQEGRYRGRFTANSR